MSKRLLSCTTLFAFLLSLFVLGSTTPSAHALELLVSGSTDSEYDGYIVTLKEAEPAGITLSESAGGVACLDGEGRVYSADTLEDIAAITDTANIVAIEPNYTMTLFAVNDPLYSADQWNLQQIGASVAWDLGFTGQGVRVGVIDSGINRNHTDFAGASIETGYNFLTHTADTTDTVSHATFVSGIIAAQTDNGNLIAGMAEDVTIVPLKAFDGTNGDLDAIITAIYDAVNIYHCDVINMSFGDTNDTAALRTAIQYAYSHNVILVAAAGNDGTTVLQYPAAYSEVIGVGSVAYNSLTSILFVSSFSQRNSSVFVTAPGSGITSLRHDNNSLTTSKSGTSFSTPHVAALAAIAKQAIPGITANEFKALLQSSATDLGTSGYDVDYGYGFLNVDAFVNLLPNVYQITYQLNGGTGAADVSYLSGTDAFDLPVPSRSGYRFDGWYEAADFNGSKVTSITVATVGDKTYYAKWLSSDTTLTGVTLGVTVGVAAGVNAFTITLPADTQRLPTDITLLSAVPHDANATYVVSMADYGAVWTITVTAEDGLTTAVYTVGVGIDDATAYLLTVGVNDAAYGSAAGTGRYAAGVTVPVAAVPNDGYILEMWSADSGSFTGDYTISPAAFVMPVQAATVTAQFRARVAPAVTPASALFDKHTDTSDLLFSLAEGDDSFTGIDGLTVDTDYLLAADRTSVTLKNTALTALSTSAHSLVFQFASSATITVEIIVSDSSENSGGSGGGLPIGGGGGGGGGGGSSTTTYAITATAGTGGKISPDTAEVAENKSASFTVTPDEKYLISDVLVDGVSVGAVAAYTFEGVTADHTIEARFAAIPWENPFGDVKSGDWFYDSVEFVNENGLFRGTDLATFDPQSQMTRAMFVTVLGRLFELSGGTINSHTENAYRDAVPDSWYYESMLWASELGIVKGYGSDRFAPNASVTREQIAVFLYRYVQTMRYSAEYDSTAFYAMADSANTSSWAHYAMKWAVDSGLLAGKGSGKLDPGGVATRAEVAQIFLRLYALYMEE